MEMRLARIDANHAPTLKAAQSKRTAIQKKIAGVSGVVKIEIPAAVLSLVIMSWSFGLSGWNVIVVLFSALAIGKVVRGIVNNRAATPVVAAQEAHHRDRDICRKENEANGNDIARQFSEKRAKPQKELDAVAGEKAALKEAGRKKSEAIRRQWDGQIAKAESEFERGAQPLRAQLMRSVNVKKIDEQWKFPAYKAACDNGFQNGEEPSSDEREMTFEERARATAMLY